MTTASSFGFLTDQADGLRRMFAASQQCIVPVASNAFVEESAALIERFTAAFVALGAEVLVVDAAPGSPAPHDLAAIDLAACIEPLGGQTSYLAASGLPRRYTDMRGSSAALLERICHVGRRFDVIVLHAGATDLARMLGTREVRPVLLASSASASLTDAYASMKLLVQRTRLMTFDVLVASRGRKRLATEVGERLATCADKFLGAVLSTPRVIEGLAAAPGKPSEALMDLATDHLKAVHLPADTTPPVPFEGWNRPALTA